MSYDFRDNRTNYEKEKEVREKRLSAYSEDIQKRTLEQSCELIRQLVEERQRQGMTQQEVADITGIMPSNLARLESGKRVPTLVVLQKYASNLYPDLYLNIRPYPTVLQICRLPMHHALPRQYSAL